MRVFLIILLVFIVGCASQSTQDNRITTSTDPTGFDDKIVIDLALCEGRDYEFIWASGSENVLVLGEANGSCQFIVTSEIKGRGSTWDCILEKDGRFIVTQNTEDLPTYSHALTDVCKVSNIFSSPDTSN